MFVVFAAFGIFMRWGHPLWAVPWLFVVTVVIAAVVGGVVLANQRFVPPWSDRLVFYANFAASPGVSPGNGQEVRIAGVNVGDIVGAEVDDSGQTASITGSVKVAVPAP